MEVNTYKRHHIVCTIILTEDEGEVHHLGKKAAHRQIPGRTLMPSMHTQTQDSLICVVEC